MTDKQCPRCLSAGGDGSAVIGSCPHHPVHYKGAGRTGLHFDCYQNEIDIEQRYPRSSSSLDRVTCESCWDEIHAMWRGLNPREERT